MAAFNVSVKYFVVKMTLRLFQPLSVVTTMVPTLLRQLRRSFQIKKIITNAPCVLQFAAQPKHIFNNSEKSYWDTSGVSEKLQKLHRKRSNNQPVMRFTHSVSEIRIYRVFSGNKLDGVQLASFHFKTKSIRSKAIFLRIFFLKLQIIRLVQLHWSCTSTH